MSSLEFLNSYYQKVAWAYDATRAYYLFGRNRLLEQIIADYPLGAVIVEVGAGTGRNLRFLEKRLPRQQTKLFAVEPCTPMQRQILRQQKSGAIKLIPKLSHQWSSEDIGEKADVILFSYSLSMFSNPLESVQHALQQLKPGGSLYIVDFGLLVGTPKLLSLAFRAWLRSFHDDPAQTWQELAPIMPDYPASVAPFDYFRTFILSSPKQLSN